MVRFNNDIQKCIGGNMAQIGYEYNGSNYESSTNYVRLKGNSSSS